MGAQSFSRRPPRCALVNVETAEHVEALFNPPELTEKIGISWQKLTVLGMSHQVHQYQHTQSRSFSGVEFYLDRLLHGPDESAPDIMEFRRFLLSFTVASAGQLDELPGAPARCLIIWPGFLTVESSISSVEFRYRAFAIDGPVLRYTAAVKFDEVLDVRVTAEERRRDG
jgi:hypothetical protein